MTTQAPEKQSPPKPSGPPPHRRGAFLSALPIVVLVLVVAAAAFLLGKRSGHGSASPPKQPAAAKQPSGPPSVTLTPEQASYADLSFAVSQTATLPTRLSALGTIAPNINGMAQVSPRLAGKVVSVSVGIGENVNTGQVLAVLSSPDLATAQAAVHDSVLRREAALANLRRLTLLGGLGEFGRPALLQARTAYQQVQGEVQIDKDAVNAQQAQVVQAAAQDALAQNEFARAQALFAALLISRQGLDQAQANAAQAHAALAAAQTALRAAVDKQLNAQKRLQIAGRALSRQETVFRSGVLTSVQTGPARAALQMASHEVEAAKKQVQLLGGEPVDEASAEGGLLPIKAPIGGRISTRTVSVGDLVTPDHPLLTILNARTVVALLHVYQEDLPNVRIGMGVTVTSNTAPGRTYRGVVSTLGLSVDPQTRTVPVLCALRNPDGALRPGAYVSGTISGAARMSATVVPESAVQSTDKGLVVFVPGPNKPNLYVAQPVKAGATANGFTQIKDGLTAGQKVVTHNAFLLKSELGKQGPGG